MSTIALTATAAISTHPYIYSSNITPQTKHCVLGYWKEITFAPLIDEVQRKRHHMPRVIIFCQRYNKSAALYETFLIALGKEFTEPVGAPNVTQFLLVDMYTSPTHKAGKDAIVSSFHMVDSQLRIRSHMHTLFGCQFSWCKARDTLGATLWYWGVHASNRTCKMRWKIGLCTGILFNHLIWVEWKTCTVLWEHNDL